MPALEAFLAVQTQWSYVSGMGGAHTIGLDYAGVRAGLELAGIKLTPDQFHGLQLIELGARQAMNRRAS